MREHASEKLIRLVAPLRDDDVLSLRAGDRVLISGQLIGARDAAHRRLVSLIEAGESLPFDPQGQVIYYAGPAPARPGSVMGPAAPTTALRMDAYAPALMAQGVKGMIGKGNRGPEVRAALQEYGCVYFAGIGGASVLLSKPVVSVETICYEDLGTEAIRRMTVEDFPVVVANDAHGRDIYESAREYYARVIASM
ncbi:MAG: fumarate hydratase C-terminal domain-containing protein [Armatimonadetes bacterium]|nr:fumarate hydratase C-terminal domain-containing protein [Armatimonadota bacterium]